MSNPTSLSRRILILTVFLLTTFLASTSIAQDADDHEFPNQTAIKGLQQTGGDNKSTGNQQCSDGNTENNYAPIVYSGYTLIIPYCEPEAVTLLTGAYDSKDPNDTTFSISWNHDDPASVSFYRLTETSSDGQVSVIDIDNGSTTSITLDKGSVGPHGEYSYDIEACNPQGCSGVIGSLPFLVEVPPPQPPTSVTPVFDNETSMQFTVSWQHPNPASVDHYQITWAHPLTSGNEYIETKANVSGQMFWSHTPMYFGDYEFRVQACSQDRCGWPTDFAVLQQPIPAPPTGLDGELISSLWDYRINWLPSPSANVSHYKFIEKMGVEQTSRNYDAAVTSVDTLYKTIDSGVFEYSVLACNSEDQCSVDNFPFANKWEIPKAPDGFNWDWWQSPETTPMIRLGWGSVNFNTSDLLNVLRSGNKNIVIIETRSGPSAGLRHIGGQSASNGALILPRRLGNGVDLLPGEDPFSAGERYTYRVALCYDAADENAPAYDPIKCGPFSERLFVDIEEPPKIPEDIFGYWTNRSQVSYDIAWSHPELDKVTKFVVNEWKGAFEFSPDNSYDVTGQTSLAFSNKQPDTYYYTVEACANLYGGTEEICSDPSPLFSWDATSDATNKAGPAQTLSDVPEWATSKPNIVGSTVGEFLVSPSGNATYTIPIATAPGSGGLVPQLNLSYDSGAGDGPLGIGWKLSGASYITRCGKTYEQDETQFNAGVQINDEDRACLDGQRLILISGTYWGQNSQYRTEIDTFSRIRFNNGAFTVERKDGSFSSYGGTVDSKIIARTGSNDLSQSPTITWALDRLEDSSGNYIEYEYQQEPDTSEFVLLQVRYTGNSTINEAPYNFINFVYSQPPKANASPRYIGGAQISLRNQLQRIDSLAISSAEDDGTGVRLKPVRSYKLSYSNGDGHFRETLTSIQECGEPSGATDQCFAPTTFDWNVVENRLGPAGNSFNAKPLSMKTFDLNGDGRLDVIYTVRTNSNEPTGDLRIRKATASGFTNISNAEISVPTSLPVGAASGVEYFDGVLVSNWRTMDINTDGLDDLVYPNLASDRWEVRLSTGDNLGPALAAGAGTLQSLSPREVQVLDFTGDGRPDLIFHSSGTNGLFLSRNITGQNQNPMFAPPIPLGIDAVMLEGRTILEGAGPRSLQVYFSSAGYPDTRVSVAPLSRTLADYDGNGSVDLLVRLSLNDRSCAECQPPENPEEELTTVYEFSSESPSSPQNVVGNTRFEAYYIAWGVPGENRFVFDPLIANSVQATGGLCNIPSEACRTFTRILPSDVNGDGLSDLITERVVSETESSIELRVNRGAYFSTFSPPQLLDRGPKEQLRHFQIADVDGDGLGDLLTPNAGVWNVDRNLGLSFIDLPGEPAPSATERYLSTVPAGNPSIDVTLFADFTGDGKTDAVHWTRDETPPPVGETLVNYLGTAETGNSNNRANAIERIENGYGAKTDIHYRPLTDINVYLDSVLPGPISPGRGSAVYDINAPVFVVSEVLSDSPVGGTSPSPTARRTVTYEYRGARIQAGGRGFLGFESITQVDLGNCEGAVFVNSCLNTETKYRQDFPFIGLVERVESTLGGKPLQRRTITWESELTYGFSDGREIHHVYQDTVLDQRFTHDGTTTSQLVGATVTEYEYNEVLELGNPTKVTIRTTGANGAEIYRSVTTNTFNNDLSNWHLGRLESSSVVSTRSGESTTRNYSYLYHPIKGLLTEESVASDGLVQTKRYGLDNFGNRRSTEVSGTFVPARTSYTYHDSLGRYPQVRHNALGQIIETVRERDQWGNALKVADILDSLDGDTVSTTALVDSMGRQYFRFSRDGSWQRAHLDVASSHCPATAGYRSVEYIAGASTGLNDPTSFLCFDRIQREVRNATTGFVSDYDVVDTEYDPAGLVARRSEPAARSASKSWNTFEYDVLGRTLSSQTAAGRQMDYEWDNLPSPSEEFAGSSYVIQKSTMNRRVYPSGLPQSIVVLRREYFNTLRETVAVIEDFGGANQATTKYFYDPNGDLREVFSPHEGNSPNVVMTMEMDGLGNVKKLTDPDSGITDRYFNAIGQLVCEKHANDEGAKYLYDSLGRLVIRQDRINLLVADDNCDTGQVVETSIWSYEGNSFSSYDYGRLVEQCVMPGQASGCSFAATSSKTFSYDKHGRLSQTTSLVKDGSTAKTLSETLTYDSLGRVFTELMLLPVVDGVGEKGVQYEYNSNGYVSAVLDAQGQFQTVFERIVSQDARGNSTQTNFGNGLITERNYLAASGFLTEIKTHGGGTNFQLLEHDFDPAGNMLYRRNAVTDRTETFEYDRLDRLIEADVRQGLPTDINLQPPAQNSTTYEVGGNIASRNGNTYSYGALHGQCNGTTAPGPHALTSTALGKQYCYDQKGNRTSVHEGSVVSQQVSYTTFNKPSTITTGSNNTHFEYGADRSRTKRIDDWLGRTTYYFGSTELIVDSAGTRYKRRVGTSVVITQTGVTDEVRYLHKDHLGSSELITDEFGSNALGVNGDNRPAFGPWGQRRMGDTWSNQAPTTTTLVNGISTRGFTGHEMLDSAGIIHMNGRIYDPETARFLSPDPIIQELGNTQNFNRYSYVLNNPLRYTDPSGYCFDGLTTAFCGPLIGAAIIGGGYFSYAATESILSDFYGWLASLDNQPLSAHPSGTSQGAFGPSTTISFTEYPPGLTRSHQEQTFLWRTQRIDYRNASVSGCDECHPTGGGNERSDGVTFGEAAVFAGSLVIPGYEIAVCMAAGGCGVVGWFVAAVDLTPVGKVGKLLKTVFKRGSPGAAKGAFEIAKEGGTHSGQLREFLKQNAAQLGRSIRSFDKNIAKHEKWILNPKSKIPEWDTFNAERQARTIHHWRKDIARARELQNIAIGVAKEKGFDVPGYD